MLHHFIISKVPRNYFCLFLSYIMWSIISLYRFPGVFQATHHHLSQKEEELHWKTHAMVLTMFLNPNWSRLNPVPDLLQRLCWSLPTVRHWTPLCEPKKVKLTDSKIMTLTFPRLGETTTKMWQIDPTAILCLTAATNFVSLWWKLWLIQNLDLDLSVLQYTPHIKLFLPWQKLSISKMYPCEKLNPPNAKYVKLIKWNKTSTRKSSAQIKLVVVPIVSLFKLLL